ncbi:MAG TPA: hypothetical protein VMH48_04975, partial [Methylomirabilota bacterium]|nr:hypothetical protein [Methylomirabilota bacterium]
MSRVLAVVLRLMGVAILLGCGVSRMRGQTPAPAPASEPAKQEPGKQDATKQDAAKKEGEEEEENPFLPQPAPALPAGMSGSDTSDPRAKLTAGLYDAGEAAMGMKHLALVK